MASHILTTDSGRVYEVAEDFGGYIVLREGNPAIPFQDILDLAREYVRWNRVDTIEVIQALGFTDDD